MQNKKEAVLFGKWISKMSLLGRLELVNGDFKFREGSGVYAIWWDTVPKELYREFKRNKK